MLQQTTDYLSEVRSELQEKNEDILASIRYASYIQNAIVPDIAELRSHVPESFIFYRPRDIVSGDLPYILPYNDGLLIAAMDCTGHGVPGAMIAMLGFSLLNESSMLVKQGTPHQLLAKLNQLVRESFSKQPSMQVVQDGMDIALAWYHPPTRRLQFAGARRPLFFVSGGVLHELEGHPHSIGSNNFAETDLATHTLDLKTGDSAFLFSDGFIDQFGQETGKKFLKTRFRNLCLQMASSPAQTQQALLGQTFDSWKGNLRQTDDVLVLGLNF